MYYVGRIKASWEPRKEFGKKFIIQCLSLTNIKHVNVILNLSNSLCLLHVFIFRYLFTKRGLHSWIATLSRARCRGTRSTLIVSCTRATGCTTFCLIVSDEFPLRRTGSLCYAISSKHCFHEVVVAHPTEHC